MGRKSRNKAKRARGPDVYVVVAGGDESAPRQVNPCAQTANVADGANCTHKRARVERTRVDDDLVDDGPLSAADMDQFERDGFVLLRDAFPPDTARACRELLWTRLALDGIHREDASSWVDRHGVPECYTGEDAPEWEDVMTSRLRVALDQLCGSGRWEDFGLGWWMITFPDQADPPWGAAGKWHVDGASYQHHINSKESGLLAIFLFSDIAPGEGGTALAKGSHKWIARLLDENEPRGMKGGAVSFHARSYFAQQLETKHDGTVSDMVVEVNGRAGDVMLVHPFLLHARSKNLGTKGSDSVRFMCNPNIRLHQEMDLNRADGAYSAVERAIVRALYDP